MIGQACASRDFDSWIRSIQSICGRFDSRPALNRSLFIGEIARQDLAGLEVAQIRTNAGLISRQGT
ncbi:MAG: transcriptional regulator FeaR, partial [Longimicrobiales bacterium]